MVPTKTLLAMSMIGLALAGCAPTPWPRSRSSIEVAQPVCADFRISIYFERDEADLTREARSVLASAKTQARSCAAAKARVVGLADAAGASDVNLALSKRRAESVTRALVKAGFPRVEIDQTAVGDAGAINAAGASAPLRRRADIFFDLEPASPPRR